MSSPQPITAGILIVSTTVSSGQSTDSTGPELRKVFAEDGDGQWDVVKFMVVPDDVRAIQNAISEWSEQRIQLIVTAGGTGFSQDDCTPEAVRPYLERQAPGLVHAMLAAGLAATPLAMMARPLAGMCGRTIIMTLPGSPKGATENLRAVVKTLPHACRQAAGASSRELHEEGEGGGGGAPRSEETLGMRGGQVSISDLGGGCLHHRDERQQQAGHAVSNDTSLGAASRQRTSPYPMLSVDEALRCIQSQLPRPSVMSMHLDYAIAGNVLAEDVFARENVPAFRASIVDGYAIAVPPDGRIQGQYPVASALRARAGKATTLEEGKVARITTGAPLPIGATAVVMVEKTEVAATRLNGREESEITIHQESIEDGENVREVGSDIQKASLVLRKGVLLSAAGGEIGVLVAAGLESVKVYRRPRVCIISTGDELVSCKSRELKYGEVRDTNRPTLFAAVAQWNGEGAEMDRVGDDARDIKYAIQEALKGSDVVITTGGVSMGECDLLKPTIERELGGTIHFGRVAMKPGKPTTFATVPNQRRMMPSDNDPTSRQVIFALPGNPASALVTFHLFVLPALRQLEGHPSPSLPVVTVSLAHDFPLDKVRPEYHRAVVRVTRDGTLMATSTGGQRSSRVGSMCGANALLRLPPGPQPLLKYTRVDAMLIGELESEIA